MIAGTAGDIARGQGGETLKTPRSARTGTGALNVNVATTDKGNDTLFGGIGGDIGRIVVIPRHDALTVALRRGLALRQRDGHRWNAGL